MRYEKIFLSKHHLVPKERKKLHTENEDQTRQNFGRVLMLWNDKHFVWHYLFHNLTLSEIISLLQRIERLKNKKSPHLR